MEAIMNRLLLAVSMLTVLSGPALAAYPKAQDEFQARNVVSTAEHRQSSRMLPRSSEQGEATDPYWTPCDYSTDYKTNSCE
jgi:hypothetical protein